VIFDSGYCGRAGAITNRHTDWDTIWTKLSGSERSGTPGDIHTQGHGKIAALSPDQLKLGPVPSFQLTLPFNQIHRHEALNSRILFGGFPQRTLALYPRRSHKDRGTIFCDPNFGETSTPLRKITETHTGKLYVHRQGSISILHPRGRQPG